MIRSLLWGAGFATVPQMKAGLSPPEQCYMDDYIKLVTEYGRACGVHLHEVPPLCVCPPW